MSVASSLPQTITELQALAQFHEGEIVRLKLVIAKYQRAQFGRRSEQLVHADQLILALEGLNLSAVTVTPAEPVARQPREPSRRKPLPDHLPRETHTHLPDHDACPDCGQTLQQIGEDVSEMLEYIPASFKVIRHVRPKLACRCCDCIVQAAAPSRPITRGLAGPGLLAQVLIAKYCDHLPLYRQSQIYAREGVELERSTMAGWVGQASYLLNPLVEAIRRHVLAGDKLHADDTPVPVLAPGQGKTKTGRLWTYVRDDRPAGSAEPPAVWFAYSPDRKGERPQTHLKSYRGALQADGYAGFNALYTDGEVHEVACWAHVRRKFYEIYTAHASPVAAEALARIAQLYGVESQIRGAPPEQRRSARQSRARPILDDLQQWLQLALVQLSTKSDLAVAIRYALTRWVALSRYLENGKLEADNNTAERALRAITLGRKNYLFHGSDAGGERAAAIYSLIGSAKLNGLDPMRYLREVLSIIADHPINQIDRLLPWHWAQTGQAQPQAA